MASFKRESTEAGTTYTTVYTVPAGMTTVVIGLRIANKNESESIGVDVEVAGDRFLGDETPIPIGSSIDALGSGKLVMQAGEVIRVRSTLATSADVTLSILEDV